MDYIELVKIRVLSFLYNLCTAIIGVLLVYLMSPEFSALVHEHFGAVIGSIVMLVIPEVVKHIRNVRVVSSWQRVGGNEFRRPTLI